ncbi:very short patch repair endonuclease [Methylocapsa palsarum]|uniref:Very short patch repair endonuclease n=1 Tax=Methylocapsa palsarum TaxID=1612308 RepID=A0A1I4DD61_9HYPH|nr:very short patch repair endonuclease [Methylocapsa palsarum]SFK90046.1 DNA mismatch endonuclease, patch repair protein [Methylocapsa palsarum]
MPDIVDSQTRSRMMAGIRSQNTKPEMIVRRGLHARGLRFRLHPRDVAGRPDIVLPRFRAALFIHGCFWHGHDCHLFRLPDTRREFWQAKIKGNQTRDAKVRAELAAGGWRTLTVWECALRGRTAGITNAVDDAAAWVRSAAPSGEIRGAS